MKSSNLTPFGFVLAGVLALGSEARGQQDVLPPIQLGTIAITLQPVATGLAAPVWHSARGARSGIGRRLHRA